MLKLEQRGENRASQKVRVFLLSLIFLCHNKDDGCNSTNMKTLDNIDLNQMSHRYASSVLKNDWNDPVDFRWLDQSQRGCYIWVSLSYKTVNIVVSSSYHKKKVKSVIESAVLHWTTWLMVFPRNAGFGRCYLVSTRHEILSNIDRNLTGTRLRPRKNRNKINPARVRIPSQFYCCHLSLKQ